MAQQPLVIRARIEEVPILTQFTIDSLNRDLADFQAYKPSKYTPGFITNLSTQKGTVEAIINPKQLTAELKLITARIFTNTHAIRPLMDHLEGYVADAVGLTVAPKDFGISPVRKKINNDDQEGLAGALNYIITNITNNLASLTAVDYPPAELTSLQNLRTQLSNDNAAQNQKLEARRQLVVNNIKTINDLATILKAIWADGKHLYKTTHESKLPDYTNSRLLARIRQDTLHTKITGTVKDKNGALIKSAKLVAKPVLGGRTKTIKSDSKGIYTFKGVKPVLLNITVSAKNISPFLVQIEAVTNTTITLNIQQPNVP